MTDKKDKQKKTTSEKPVSLNPLTFDEALNNLAAVKPPPKAKSGNKSSKAKE